VVALTTTIFQDLDKRLLTRFYRSSTLAAPEAKTGWVEPDLRPIPVQSG
jgi:hypothetical protein